MSVLERFGINSQRDNFRETAVYALACVYSFIEKEIADYLRPFSLTPAKFNAMMVIKHIGKEEGLSQIGIGRRLIVTASNMTRVLDKLEKEDYIERCVRKGDRRVNLIRISRKGCDVLNKVWPGYYRKLIEVADLLEKNELRQVSRLIVKWCDMLGERNGKPAR